MHTHRERSREKEREHNDVRREFWGEVSDYVTISPHIYFLTLNTLLSFEPIPFMKHTLLS